MPSSTGNANPNTPGSPPARIKTAHIFVNDKPVTVPRETNVAEILATAGLPPDFRLYEIRGDREIAVPIDETIKVHPQQRFLAAPTLDPAVVAHSPVHDAAIESVRASFPAYLVEERMPGDGTVVVCVRGVDIGTGWNQPVVDLEVRLQPSFPTSPPYPYYVGAGLARTDGRSFGQVQPHVGLPEGPRTQISLNKPFDPTVETLGARIASVIAWLRDPR